MKNKRRYIFWRLAMVATIGFGCVASSRAQLISNGSFEAEPAGTEVVIDSSASGVDGSTFMGWRFFSVGDPPIDSFSITSVTNASEGRLAVRLDKTDTGSAEVFDYGLDRWDSRIPIDYGKDYTFSFDAARISGTINLQVRLEEYDANGNLLGAVTYSYPVSSSTYQTTSLDWSPSSPLGTLLYVRLVPLNSGAETSLSMLLDNVRLTRDDLPAEGLYTPVASFNKTDHVVSTIVFDWYTSGSGQHVGPWLPLEGRPAWTGEPDWWKDQVKQIMMANIDLVNVQVFFGYKQQRINLLNAMNQLRYEGYDVPQVSPFVGFYNDDNSIDVATVAGKDEFTAPYIEFYNEYYGVNQDAHADGYIAQYDDQPLLNVYRVQDHLTNTTSLTRNDVTSRLLAEFGANSIFANDIYMASAQWDDPTITFSDEKNASFGAFDYYRKTTWAGVDAAMVKPGYWTQNYDSPGAFYPRDGGSHYTAAWNSVNADSSIDRVYVETWNEYDQGSGIYAADPINSPYIAPSNTSGNTDTWSSSNDPYEYIRTTAAGAAVFNDVQAYDAQIIWDTFPDRMYVGETQVVSVVVRNAGDISWTAAAGYQFGDKAGGAALFGADRYLLDDNADEIPIYGGIFRGRPKAFQVTLVAPSAPGIYETHWGMVQDAGTVWFGEDFAHTFEVVDISDIQVQIAPEATVEGYNVVSWFSEPELAFAVHWSPDLVFEPFVLLEEGMVWPQSSYTDQTVRAGTEGFYRVNVSLVEPEVIDTVTNATVWGTGFAEVEGSSIDDFEGATITSYSAMHPVSTFPDDWFTSPNSTELLFNDAGAGTAKFIEFNTAGPLSLTKLTVWLSGDDNDFGNEGRAIRNIKLWSSTVPGVFNENNLAVNVAVNPDYDATTGSHVIGVSIDLDQIVGQYYRIEFVQDDLGARVREIDAFSE